MKHRAAFLRELSFLFCFCFAGSQDDPRYLLERGGDSVVAVPARGRHERMAHVHGEVDTDAYSEDDLDRRHGAQSDAPEVHQARDADHDADHRDRHTRDGDRVWDEDQSYEQHPCTTQQPGK